MSTRIFNAYKWNGSLQELILLLNKMKEKYIEDCANRFHKLYKPLDYLSTYENQSNLLKKIEQDSSRLEKGYPFDVEFSCVVYQHKGQIVVHFFGYNEYNYPSLKSDIDALQFYSYWNSSDGPDDMDYEVFESIGKWFDDLFETYGSTVPSKCGLTYEFGNSDSYYRISDRVESRWRNETKAK